LKDFVVSYRSAGKARYPTPEGKRKRFPKSVNEGSIVLIFAAKAFFVLPERARRSYRRCGVGGAKRKVTDPRLGKKGASR